MEKGHDRRIFALACAAGIGWLALYAAWTAIAPWGADGQRWFSNVPYHLPIVAATVVALAAWHRGRVGSRSFWALLALSNAVWLAAELVWSVRELSTGDVPFPWWPDAGYLTSYGLLLAAAVAGFRPSLRALGLRELLDGALLVATLALLWWWVIVRPLGLAGDATTLVGVAYPVLGLVLLGFLVATRFIPARRGTLTLKLFSLGILSTAVADGLYTHAAITHSYLPGDWINLGWQAEAVLFTLAGVAALRIDTRSEWARWRPPNRLGSVAGVAGSAAAVALVLAADARDGLEPSTVAAVGVVAALLLARAVFLVRDGFAAGELREAASGAYTPTYLLESAGQHLRRARHLDEVFAIALFDLGERGMDLPARRIVAAAAPLDSVGRMDERRLAVVLALTTHENAAAAADRLRAAGGGHTSAGVAVWTEADEVTDLVERADGLLRASLRLGGAHTRGPDPDRLLQHDELGVEQLEQLLDLTAAVDVRYGVGDEHSRDVARIARELGIALDLEPEEIQLCYLGGLLHAVGTLRLTDDEASPAGLSPAAAESAPIQHAFDGAEILQRIPCVRAVAPIVGAHQEHWDGTGSPRGRAGEEIPMAARVVAVANAIVTQTTTHPRRARSSLTSALTEIWRFSEKRYDPAVVSTLLRLVREGGLTEMDEVDTPYEASAARVQPS